MRPSKVLELRGLLVKIREQTDYLRKSETKDLIRWMAKDALKILQEEDPHEVSTVPRTTRRGAV